MISTHSPNAAQRTAPRPPFAMLMGHEYLGAPEAEARVIVCHPGGLFKVRHRNHQILNAAVDTRISGMLRNTRRRSTTKTTAREQKKQSPRGAFRADSSECTAPVGGASGRQYARTALQIFVGSGQWCHMRSPSGPYHISHVVIHNWKLFFGSSVHHKGPRQNQPCSEDNVWRLGSKIH